ncbi:MAG: aminopeptidase [Bacilli bacterium]|nr:aminopeptidase [Bacilli bacterium]
MQIERLRKYARLIAEVGINTQKKEEIWINADLDQPDFVVMVMEECYKLGARKVVIRWSYSKTVHPTYKYASISELSKVPSYERARYKYMSTKFPSIIHIISDDPDGLKGINQKKMAKVRMKSYPIIKPYRDKMEDRYKWCIAAVPGLGWAKKVFPTLSNEDAIEALWEAILKTARVDDNDPIKNWEEHNAFLHAQKHKLNELNLDKLIYHASNGTDFEVTLIPNSKWGGGYDLTHDGRKYNPNIPTEEIFISPYAGKCEGTLVASKPLSYNGEVIEDFSLTFKNGKVVEVKARKNQALLEQMVSLDEGAKMLGEVALVPFNSPINETGILFYDTLFDENACCHFAIGAGFPMTIEGAADLTPEQIKEKGINDSMTHVDFMIGTSDLSIVGITREGKEIQIFKDGTWAI